MSSSEEPTDPQARRAAGLVIDQANAINDPTNRAKAAGAILESIPYIQTRLRNIRQLAVQELRAEGLSHAEIGERLGLHRNRAQQIAKGATGSAKRPAENKPADAAE